MNQETLDVLILDLIDGSISAEDFAYLENELRSNPQAVETYVALSRVENLLHLSTEIKSHEIKSVVPMESILKRQRSKTIKLVLLSTAALILVGITLMNVFFVKNDDPTLTFKTSPQTEFSITHSSDNETKKGLVLEKGSRLKITQGTVELTFKSGVKSIVSAPAELNLISDEHISLKEGSAWFQVPTEAIGFEVTTGSLNIVDLGTEFGVHSRPDRDDEVHVFKGKVSVTTKKHSIQTVTLVANEARCAQDFGRLKAIDSNLSEFLTVLPNSLPHIYWSFDNEDGFKAEGSHPDASEITTTPKSGAKLETGKINQALILDGKGQYLATDWDGILGSAPKSLACWIKLDPDNPDAWGTIIEWGKLTNNNYWRCRITPKKSNPKHAVLRLGFGRYQCDGTSNLADGNWHHIAIVDREATGTSEGSEGIEFYIDGVREQIHIRHEGALKTLGRNTLKGVPAMIGNPNSDSNLSGKIDELYLFYGALTYDRIKELSSVQPQ